MPLTFTAVLPAIDPELAHACIVSMHAEIRARLLLVDNTGMGRIAHVHRHGIGAIYEAGGNLGVPASWNLGVRLMREKRTDYLLIISQSVRFGNRHRGVDLLAELEQRRPAAFMDGPFGWKLIAIAAPMFDAVGPFDPYFSPALYEESDWMMRAHLAGLHSPWYNQIGKREQFMDVDATSEGDAVAMRRGLVPELNSGVQRAKYVAKWHGDPRDERTTHPYGLERLDWRYVGDPPADAVPPPAQVESS